MDDKEKFKEVIRLFYDIERQTGSIVPRDGNPFVCYGNEVTIRKNLKKIMVILKTREMELVRLGQSLKINEDGIWPPDESELEKVTTLVEKLYKFVDCLIQTGYSNFQRRRMIRSDLEEIEKIIKKISRNYNLEL